MRSAAKTQSAGDDKRWFCGRLLCYSMDCSVFRAFRSFQAHTKITHRNKLSRCPAIECKAVTTRCQKRTGDLFGHQENHAAWHQWCFPEPLPSRCFGRSTLDRCLAHGFSLLVRVCSWFPSSAVKSTSPGTVECCCAGTSSRWEAAVRSGIRHIGTLSEVLPH